MLENFKNADEIRKEANIYHAQLTDKIANINSIKEKKSIPSKTVLPTVGKSFRYILTD